MDIFEELAAATNDDLLTQYKQLERTTSIETLSVKSEPTDNEELQKRRVAPTSTPSSSSSLSANSFLISPPANPHPHKTKTTISSAATTSSSNPRFPTMITNSNNNTFAPRIPPPVSQKNNWPPHLQKPLSTAQKRPGPPVIYPPTAQRNSNHTSTNMRIPPVTSLQPQSFDAFSINPSAVQRRPPNGIPHPSNTPPIVTRNPVRVSTFSHTSSKDFILI